MHFSSFSAQLIPVHYKKIQINPNSGQGNDSAFPFHFDNLTLFLTLIIAAIHDDTSWPSFPFILHFEKAWYLCTSKQWPLGYYQ